MEFGPGIIMDGLVILIVLLSTIWGMKKGLVFTVISFMQWFVCLIVGFLFAAKVKAYLMDNTVIPEAINNYVLTHMKSSIEDSSSYQAIPKLFGGLVKDASDAFAYGTAASITSVLISVISFLIIVLGIKLVCFFIARLFSKKYQKGAVGFFDGFFGFTVGLVRGIIYVFVFLAVLVPILTLIWPTLSQFVMEGLEDSHISGYMYENNFILILLRDLFS